MGIKSRTIVLSHITLKNTAIRAVEQLPIDGTMEVVIRKVKRTLPQNAIFHAICGNFAKSGYKWFNKPRNDHDWKILLVSGHSIVTGKGADVVEGLEGELVSLRESTAEMNKEQLTSLIDYTEAFASEHNIKLLNNKYG